MSDVEGTRTASTFTDYILTPKGMATVATDHINSVECPKCGFHIRAGHRPNVYCRYCKNEITVDSEYRFLFSNSQLGIKSLDWSYHMECYDKAVHKGQLTE